MVRWPNGHKWPFWPYLAIYGQAGWDKIPSVFQKSVLRLPLVGIITEKPKGSQDTQGSQVQRRFLKLVNPWASRIPEIFRDLGKSEATIIRIKRIHWNNQYFEIQRKSAQLIFKRISSWAIQMLNIVLNLFWVGLLNEQLIVPQEIGNRYPLF